MNISELYKSLKKESGSHSPSIETLKKHINKSIEVDACFLSNPYATDLFFRYLKQDLLENDTLKDYLEYYPPQNIDIANILSDFININKENIFVGNGAIEIIQAVIQNFCHGKICIPIPTFSSYYEFVDESKLEIVYYELIKNNYKVDEQKLSNFILENKINNVVLINPNNPDGNYIELSTLIDFLKKNKHLDNIIIDESFIHFAYENKELDLISIEPLFSEFKNLTIIKSMSKDFGIAGIRAGYALMDAKKVKSLIKNGYLWNINGLAYYFFKLYCNQKFQKDYEVVRKKYIINTIYFIEQLKKIENIKIIESKSNFVLVKHIHKTSFELMITLLNDFGIYVRDCSDKIGLEEGFVRIASRTFEENEKIIFAVNEISKK